MVLTARYRVLASADLLGARVDVIVSIVRGRGFDPKYANGIFCKFDFYGNPGETTMVQGTSDPEFDFRQQVRCPVRRLAYTPLLVVINASAAIAHQIHIGVLVRRSRSSASTIVF